jgi:hypothetical protein
LANAFPFRATALLLLLALSANAIGITDSLMWDSDHKIPLPDKLDRSTWSSSISSTRMDDHAIFGEIIFE